MSGATLAAQEASSDLFARGELLYQDRCAFCHGEAGEGNPPAFPALNGNERLADPAVIVNNLREGAGNMPPFPDFSGQQVAALITYVRNAWDNDFGNAVRRMDLAPGEELMSVLDGVYTEVQAERGRAAYSAPCGMCHGRRLNGAPDDEDMIAGPPLARTKFLRAWKGRSLAMLLDYTRATMPESNPGSLTDEEYLDIIAYMLSVSRLPSGDRELLPDPQRLARIVIEPMP